MSMADDWREFSNSFRSTRSRRFAEENLEIISFFSRTENLADDDVTPAPKVDPTVVNKWAGEDEDDVIKVSRG